MRLDGKDVVLIDTPGFDDTEKSDVEILELLAKNLSLTYEAGKLLHGIILLQPITTTRFTGSEAKRTRLFKKICGEDAFSHVVIASTFWEEAGNKVRAESLEKERIRDGDFWGKMLSHGATAVRHMNTEASAHGIIRKLLSKQPVALQLQEELHNNGGALRRTQAGVQLHSDLDEVSKKLLAEMEQTRRDNALSKQEMQDEIRELSVKLQEMQDQKRELESKQVRVRDLIMDVLLGLFDRLT